MNVSEKAEFIFRGVESINADTRRLYADLTNKPLQLCFTRSSHDLICVYSDDHGAFGRLEQLLSIAKECDAHILVSSIRYKDGLSAPCVCFCLL